MGCLPRTAREEPKTQETPATELDTLWLILGSAAVSLSASSLGLLTKNVKAINLQCHRRLALVTHAEAAEKAKANPHTKQGITHLEAAISEGKKKDDKAATKHAEEALTHLEAATN